jgi:polyphosphate glucokinase
MVRKSIKAGQSDNGNKARTLAVDVGGTGVKAMVLDGQGKPLSQRARIATPKHATPKSLLGVIRKLAKRSGEFDRVAVGFPGVIKDGVVYSAPNLGHGWEGFNLEKELGDRLERPARVANDADVQGMGCVSGKGLELVITLGTGFGSVLFAGGQRVHLELGHHPFHNGKTYEDELGHKALTKKGKRKWNKLLAEAIDDLKRTFNYDRLFVGGGDSKFIKLKLPANVKIVSNMDGLLGGIRLWRADKAGIGGSAARAKAKTTLKSAVRKRRVQKDPTPEVEPAATPAMAAPRTPPAVKSAPPVRSALPPAPRKVAAAKVVPPAAPAETPAG